MDLKRESSALSFFLNDRETLIAIAIRIVDNRATAEDIVQESWLRWYEKRYAAEDATHIFRSIVRNLAIDWRRSQKTEHRNVLEFGTLSAHIPSSERVVVARDELAHLVATLYRLPPRTVRAFRMRFVDGLKYKEIAGRLGISVSRSHALIEQAMIEVTLATNFD